MSEADIQFSSKANAIVPESMASELVHPSAAQLIHSLMLECGIRSSDIAQSGSMIQDRMVVPATGQPGLISLVTRPVVSLSGEPLLSAASTYATGSSTPSQRVWAYCLFDAALGPVGSRNLEGALAVLRGIDEEIKSCPGKIGNMLAMAYADSVIAVHTYLRLNPISSPIAEGPLRELVQVPDLAIIPQLAARMGPTATVVLDSISLARIPDLRRRYASMPNEPLSFILSSAKKLQLVADDTVIMGDADARESEQESEETDTSWAWSWKPEDPYS